MNTNDDLSARHDPARDADEALTRPEAPVAASSDPEPADPSATTRPAHTDVMAAPQGQRTGSGNADVMAPPQHG